MATQVQRWMAVVLMGAAGVVFGACGGGSDKSSARGTETPAADTSAGPKIDV